jgi:hypothetical protein
VGRFLQPDPSGAQEPNTATFVYARGNPLARRDGNGYQDTPPEADPSAWNAAVATGEARISNIESGIQAGVVSVPPNPSHPFVQARETLERLGISTEFLHAGAGAGERPPAFGETKGTADTDPQGNITLSESATKGTAVHEATHAALTVVPGGVPERLGKDILKSMRKAETIMVDGKISKWRSVQKGMTPEETEEFVSEYIASFVEREITNLDARARFGQDASVLPMGETPIDIELSQGMVRSAVTTDAEIAAQINSILRLNIP